MTYRAGIIGCGKIGVGSDGRPDNHLSAYLKHPEIALVGLCDTDDQLVVGTFNKYSALPHGTWPEGLMWVAYLGMVKARNLDIVSVCTPAATHRQIVCDIAPYVKAIYCEKPIALTLEDADAMIEACDKHHVILQVNHQRRFTHPVMRFARDRINTGTHTFDLIRQYFGEITEIHQDWVETAHGQVDIQYVDSQEHIFELDMVRTQEPMIRAGVAHLVNCLKTGKQSISSGEEARETLRCLLEWEKCLN
jgi:predicted dehydrogenase